MQLVKVSTLSVVSAALLAACQPGGVSSPDNRNTTSGALMGAAVGAAISGASGGGGKENTAAAAAGAALGGLIGAQLDRQAAELRRDLGDGITVTNQGNQLLVNFPQDILFATDSASVRADQRNELVSLAQNLNQYPNTDVTIVGHTDSTGTASYNYDLSNRRAGSVASILVNSGVSNSRVTATGRGEDAPVATNDTSAGRAQNRRVEVVIRPTSGA
ncbi:OmpA family protein [Qingshengfaniella alkalisoli]|uniref:OmpA family protein n=1 Tax=Qingshengfaniella alkalisoli TaxID=2599296 RepID=A0A5B8IW53_9RHOB|nr:OmpA family protein [Qingshengfaniella alkalisoli]QDY69733.1 OmpA family protein [Qingshengfaniella alkalisoli]